MTHYTSVVSLWLYWRARIERGVFQMRNVNRLLCASGISLLRFFEYDVDFGPGGYAHDDVLHRHHLRCGGSA